MNINPYIEMFYDEPNEKAIITNKKVSKTYVIGKSEYSVLKYIEEKSKIEGIDLSNMPFDESQLNELIVQFEKLEIISDKSVKNHKLNLLKIKFSILNPSKLNKKICDIMFFLIMYGSFVFIIIGMINSLYHFFFGTEKSKIDFITNIQISNLNIKSSIIILIIVFFSFIFHESGHMLTARHYDIHVPDMGIMLYWFMPTAYTDLTYINFCNNTGTKVFVLSAGMIVDAGAASVFSLLFGILPIGKYSICLLFGTLFNMVAIITNLLVFIKFDGYYILQVLINEENLQAKSYQYLKEKTEKIFLQTTVRNISAKTFSENERQTPNGIFYIIFALISLLYKPVIVLSLMLSLHH